MESLEQLPNDILKEIFNNFEDIQFLKLINRSFNEYIDRIIETDGIILTVTKDMMLQYIDTHPDTIEYLHTDYNCINFSSFTRSSERRYLRYLRFNDKDDDFDLSKIHMFANSKHYLVRSGIEHNVFSLCIPLHFTVDYFLKKHKFGQILLFREKSSQLTFNWYINKFKVSNFLYSYSKMADPSFTDYLIKKYSECFNKSS